MTDTPNGGHTPPGGYAAYLTGRLESLGLSRNALARSLGHRGASQVSRWCAGKAVPREKARAAIEAAIERHEWREWGASASRGGAIFAPQTPQDAPGGPICTPPGFGEYQPKRTYIEGTFVVERGVVEGG